MNASIRVLSAPVPMPASGPSTPSLAQHLHHQVCVDIPGPQYRYLHRHVVSPLERKSRPAETRDLGDDVSRFLQGNHRAQCAGQNDFACLSGAPSKDITPASQATALSGLPRRALPVPVDFTSPAIPISMAALFRSMPSGFRAGLPRTRRPEEALSATVSRRRMSQFAIRDPTISIAGARYSVARSTSLTLGCGVSISRPRMKAISASARG